jgi:hypothetical protein
MLTEKTRAIVILFSALALLSALPAFAGQAAAPAAGVPQAISPAGCAPGSLSLALAAPSAGLPAWLDVDRASVPLDGPSVGPTASKFHGFCPCGCSFVRDCNTSADCFGGAPCFSAPSCC